jgi:hypothetical protein
VTKPYWEIHTTPSYTSEQNARGINPFSFNPPLGNIFGTAAWESVRHVMLNMISVAWGQTEGSGNMWFVVEAIMERGLRVMVGG